jgi:hypothetical protein
VINSPANLRHAVLAAGLSIAMGLHPAAASAQASSQQAGRPQPPPAAKTAPPAQPPAVKAPQDQSPPAQTAKPAKKKASPPQTSKVWKGRGFAVVGAGAQVAGPAYTSTAVFKLNAEDATLGANATVGIGPVFGARGGMRVW